MASKHVLKISNIMDFFGNDNKTIKKGENALESNHVEKMQFDADLMMIRGEILASMKDKSYSVEITLNKSGEIVNATCKCPKGIKCHHIATLALFSHYNISVTDKECTWNAPKTKKQDLKTAEEMYPPNKQFQAIQQPISEEQKLEFRSKLSTLGNTVGFLWILQDEINNGLHAELLKKCPMIEDIVGSEEFLKAENQNTYFKEKCRLDEETINEIAKVTTGQSCNEMWCLIRKFRLTASNFGAVIAACSRKRYPESLFKSLIGEYDLDGVKAIQWGRTHETDGINFLKSELNLDVQPTGIWLSESGLLGASPDGLVGEDAIVEIKCPYSLRNDILSQKLTNNKTYILSFSDTGETSVNINHKYYHQIQGNLHILKRSKCYLCIWTLKDVVTVLVEYDPSWKENVIILEHFYINQYLPKLLET